MYSYLLWTEDSPLQLFNSTILIFDDSPFLFLNNLLNILRFHLSCLSYGAGALLCLIFGTARYGHRRALD